MTVAEALAFRKRKVVLAYAQLCGRDSESYKFFEVPHSTFYRWKNAYAAEGDPSGLSGTSSGITEPRYHVQASIGLWFGGD